MADTTQPSQELNEGEPGFARPRFIDAHDVVGSMIGSASTSSRGHFPSDRLAAGLLLT